MRRRSEPLGMVLVLALLLSGCTGSAYGTKATPTPSQATTPSISVVALGDSDTTGVGDESGRGWVGRYGTLLQERMHRPVRVDNRAVEGKSSEQLLSEVQGDQALRRAVRGADVVLLGIGGADLNAGDDALSAGTCEGRACYTPLLGSFDRNVRAIAKELHRLAPDALLRAIALPNVVPGAGTAIPTFITKDIGRYQVMRERSSICAAMRANGGRCVDVPRDFNGADLDGDAYASGLLTKDPCCYPSGKGQQRMAELVAASGLPKAP